MTPSSRIAFASALTCCACAGEAAVIAAAAIIFTIMPRMIVPPATAQAVSSSRSLAIFSRQTNGPVTWTLVPAASTATVTGMSRTSNS